MKRQTMRRKILHLVLSGVLLFSLGAIALLPQPVSAAPGEEALEFDGVGNYVDCGDKTDFEFAAGVSFTLEAWYKGQWSEDIVNALITKGYHSTSAQNPLYIMYLADITGLGGGTAGDVRLGLMMRDSGGANVLNPSILKSTTNVADGNWHYLAIVIDKTEDKAYVYVDGIQEASVDIISDVAAGVNTAPLVLMNHYNRYTPGIVDEVRISNIARAPAEITASWNAEAGERFVVDGDTVALWHMDEGSGGTIFDETANDNDGTISGAIWVAGFPFPAEAPPGVIDKIVFTTPPRTVVINQPSEAMTIQTQDAASNPVPVSGDTTINLYSFLPVGTFSLLPDPWIDISSVVIPTGNSDKTFYFRAEAPYIGDATITAAEAPDVGWTDATQPVTIQGPVQLWRAGSLDSTYLTIQAVTFAVVDGDEIIVFPGTYNGQIVIDKQITVKSQDGAASTIIDAQFGTDVYSEFGGEVPSYPAVWIQRDGVEFGDLDMGFTIRNTAPMVFPEGAEEPGEWGVAILVDAPGCTIRGNTIEDSNPVGIYANVDTAIISQNTVSASIVGIYGGRGGGSILYNTVDSGYWGIIIDSGQGNNNISNNTVSNTWGGAIMVAQGGDNNQITNNELYDNQGMAIGLQQTNNAEVSGNTITTNTTSVAGIYGIDVQGGQNNEIYDNTIEYVLVGGISLEDTSENRLSGNVIWDIYGYDLGGVGSGDANWTREQRRFERFSVKLETGPSTEPLGIARFEIPSISPFRYAEIGGALYFWAYLLDDMFLLPTYQIELDNGVILEVATGREEGLMTNEWLKLSAMGWWTHINTPDPVSQSLSAWIIQYDDAKVVKISVVYSGAADKTVYIDGSGEESMPMAPPPMEPPKGIVIAGSDRNSVSDSTIVAVDGAGVLIVESRQNMLGDNNEIVENGIGIVIENSNENSVRGSLIAANYEGILIRHSYQNQIIGNEIIDNFGGMSGVHLDGESEGNEIHANNIAGNTAFGVVKDGDWEGTTGWVNASGNWWGDASGPSGAGPGMGDAVNDFVHFEPWAERWPDETAPTMEPPLAMPRMTAVLGMFMGDVGPEETTLVVEAWDDDGGVGIAQVTVNLRELLMQMLPSPIVIRLRTDNEPFINIKVRQAMSLAINYDELRSELGGYGNIVLNPEEGLTTDYNSQTAIALLAEAGYGQGFTTEIYMHWRYADAGLADMLMGYWAVIGVDLIIRVVDMGELIHRIKNKEYEQMVSFPYGWGMIPGNKLEQWQDWLSELERSHLGHHDREVYEGVYQRGFNLREDFIKPLAWYLGEDDIQGIMEKLTLGDFFIPVTVADWGGIESYGNIDLTIVDIIQPLKEGWNLISTPVTLDGRYATLENIFNLGGGFIYDVLVDAMYYDPLTQQWPEASAGEEDDLKPLSTYYIYASGNTQIGLIFNRKPTLPPILGLGSGWNLVGLAIPPHKWDSMPVNEAMVTVEDASGVRGYSIVVSPDQRVDYSDEYRYWDAKGREYGFGGYGWNFQQSPWVYTVGSDDIPEMSIGGGYWVFMEASDTLAGFSTTPVTRVFLDEPGHDLDPLVPRYDRERVTRTDYKEYPYEDHTEIYITYSGDVNSGEVFEFYKGRMHEYWGKPTAEESSENSASLDFALVMGEATFSCHIDIVDGESIKILFKVWEPGLDLPDVPRYEWGWVAMTAYSQTTDSTGTQTNISYEGEFDPRSAHKFYWELAEHLKEKGYEEYNWEKIGDEWHNEFAWLMFVRGDEQGRTYLCLIWAERGIIEIERYQFAASVPGEYIDTVIWLWQQEIEMRKWAMWGWGEEEEP